MLENIEIYAKENRIPIMMKDGIDYLCTLIKEKNVRTILEIGSAIGYSAIKMALVSDDIKITTIEKDKERYELAVTNISQLGLSDRITIINEDALETEITGLYDLIFIDASKGNNINFFNLYKDNLNANGLIVTDNLSFHGLVEDDSLIQTKNQRGIVKKIKNYLDFLANNQEFYTTYVEVGDKISISQRRSKFLIKIDNREQLEMVKNQNIAGVILSLKDLSVNSNYYISLDELEELTPTLRNLKIFISLNKIMQNCDLKDLEIALTKLHSLGLTQILFYDLAVINITNRLGLKMDLVISQDHLNASIYSNKFYHDKGVTTSHLTNDIPITDVLAIQKESSQKIMYTVYGYLPLFYSRRYLVTNYFDYLKKEESPNNLNYLEHQEEYYPIIEEDYGTTIYTSRKLDLIKNIDQLNSLDYLIINGLMLSNEELLATIDKYLTPKPALGDEYLGFSETKTIYKVKDHG